MFKIRIKHSRNSFSKYSSGKMSLVNPFVFSPLWFYDPKSPQQVSSAPHSSRPGDSLVTSYIISQSDLEFELPCHVRKFPGTWSCVSYLGRAKAYLRTSEHKWPLGDHRPRSGFCLYVRLQLQSPKRSQTGTQSEPWINLRSQSWWNVQSPRVL